MTLTLTCLCFSDSLKFLNTLNLSHNYLQETADIEHLRLLHAVSILDISHNRIDTCDVVDVSPDDYASRAVHLNASPPPPSHLPEKESDVARVFIAMANFRVHYFRDYVTLDITNSNVSSDLKFPSNCEIETCYGLCIFISTELPSRSTSSFSPSQSSSV